MGFSDEGMHCGKREKLLLKEIDFLINIRSLTKQKRMWFHQRHWSYPGVGEE